MFWRGVGLFLFVVFLSGASVGAEDCPPESGRPTLRENADELTYSRAARLRAAAPEAPPQLSKELKVKSFGCQRTFRFRNRTYPLDSYHRQDGERLRRFIRQVPSAVSELNLYQSNRRSAHTATYIGTFGVLVALGGFFLSRSLDDIQTERTVRAITVLGGLGLTAGTFVYRFAVLRSNESHLESAVTHFNRRVRPRDRIELKLTTGITF